MSNYAPTPDASDVLGGLITDDGGNALGFDEPIDDAGDEFGEEHASYTAPPSLSGDQTSGELMYERTDARTGETTFGVRNTSRSKIRRGNKIIEPYVMIWKLTDELAVRAPTNQVIKLLKLRNEKNQRVFALKAPADLKPREFACLFEEDAGCDARFKNRSQQLRHAQKRHPALWEAKTIGNEQAQVDAMTALVTQNQEAMHLLLAQNERQAQIQNVLIERVLAMGGTLPTAEEVAKAPKRRARKLDPLDLAGRGPSPLNVDDESNTDETDEDEEVLVGGEQEAEDLSEEASEVDQDEADDEEDDEPAPEPVRRSPGAARPGGRGRSRS